MVLELEVETCMHWDSFSPIKIKSCQTKACETKGKQILWEAALRSLFLTLVPPVYLPGSSGTETPINSVLFHLYKQRCPLALQYRAVHQRRDFTMCQWKALYKGLLIFYTEAINFRNKHWCLEPEHRQHTHEGECCWPYATSLGSVPVTTCFFRFCAYV